MNFRTSSAVFRAVTLSALSVPFSTAQVRDQPNVEIRAIVKEPSVCEGAGTLPAQLIVINRGTGPVAIDIGHFKTNFTFFALIDTDLMRKRHAFTAVDYDWLGPGPAARDLWLQPNQAYVRDIQIPMEGPFFASEGLYSAEFRTSLPVSSGSKRDMISSNSTVLFETKSCEAEDSSVTTDPASKTAGELRQ